MHDLVVAGARVSFDVDNDNLDAALRTLSGQGIRSLTSQPPTLEQLFLRHYGDRAEPRPAAVAS